MSLENFWKNYNIINKPTEKITSVVKITGIPKETVRRKITNLMEIGYLEKDKKNRKLIFNLIPPNFPRLISIGRLDFMSEGLLLFTNNGDYARKLELPKSNYERVF